MDPNKMNDVCRERMERAGLLVNGDVVVNGAHSHTITTSRPYVSPVWERAHMLSTAHRLISSLAEQTQSRSQLAECRDVMAKLERMVADA